jgi:uncharacterized coiled-coil DUF342 family protein
MPQSAAQKLRDTETEIAVLQVQYSNLNAKVEDLKTGLKDLHSSLDSHMTEIRGSINSSKEEFSKSLNTFKDENKKQHATVEEKISSLEKWRWMLMGAATLAGAFGFHYIEKIITMH